MSTIRTLSKFYYGHTVDSFNRSLDFDEGSGELQATLNVGTYSATEYAAEWQRALRVAGSQLYVVTFNRTTGRLTVSAPNPFELLAGTGSRVGTGAWVMGGFTASDKIGSNTYLAEGRTGKQYLCQYPLAEYTSAEHSLVKESATVNVTPAGIYSQVSYGDFPRINMNIRVITNLTGLKNQNFVENANGVSDALDFMSYCLTKGKVEFMPDVDTPTSFTKCVLESTREDKAGSRFELKNMKTADFYETGGLVFRKVA